MPAKTIAALADKISRETTGACGDIGNSDPELWEHLYADDIVDQVKRYKPDFSVEETAAFRSLYATTKTVMDKALIPSDLVEANAVMKYQIADTLVAIAKKEPTVGAEILKDLRTNYNGIDGGTERFARHTAARLERVLGQTKPAADFDAAVSGEPSPIADKRVVFTGILSITRDEARNTALKLGASVSDSVNKHTDYLVAGGDPGQKLTKAEFFGIPVLNEQQWNELIAPKPAADKKPAAPQPPSKSA